MALIIFDVGDVVLKANAEKTYTALQRHGVTPEKAKLFYAGEEYTDFSRGKISSRKFHRLVSKRIGALLTYRQLRQAHDAHIYAVDRGVLKILSRLAQNHKIIFITDTNPWQTQREKQLVDLRPYGKILRSHETGMLKTKDGFAKVAALVKATGESTIVVGDLPEVVRSARKLGMRAVQFRNAAQLERELRAAGLI